jgi:hypothetical protein
MAYTPASRAGDPARDGPDPGDAGDSLRGQRAVPTRGGKTARLTLTLRSHPGGAPRNIQGTAPLRAIARPSSASSRATQESSAGGSATRRTGTPAATGSLTTCLLEARGSLRMPGRVLGVATRAMPRCPTGGAHGRGMTMVMVRARSMATAARGRAPRSVPTGVPSEVSTHTTCTALSRRRRPWSRPNGAHRHGSKGGALGPCQRSLAPHEPPGHDPDRSDSALLLARRRVQRWPVADQCWPQNRDDRAPIPHTLLMRGG